MTSEPSTPAQTARLAMRRGEWTGPTKHAVPGTVKCNLVVLPRADAYEFLVYCQRNPKPCPVLEVTDPGNPEPRRLAPGADVRTDLPAYRVFREGRHVEDLTDIRHLWRNDSVAILIGSGMTFDDALERAGVPKTATWVLNTNLPTVPAGGFSGTMVVTMRLMTPEQAVTACQVTARFPTCHGAPVHLGDPDAIGADLDQPIVGEPLISIPRGAMPVFWACGVTPQQAALHGKISLMITHTPAHGFISDLVADQIGLP